MRRQKLKRLLKGLNYETWAKPHCYQNGKAIVDFASADFAQNVAMPETLAHFIFCLFAHALERTHIKHFKYRV